MNRDELSSITHGDREYANPLTPSTYEHLAAWAGLVPGDRVFDAGCGAGAFLIALAQRFGTGGVGVDPSAPFIAQARERAAERAPEAPLEWVHAEIADYDAEPESFALAACIASTHAYGGLRPTLRALAALVPIGGHVLVGDGFWARDPAPEFLEALGGAEADELEDIYSMLSAGSEAGLEIVESEIARADEWDDYESELATNGEAWLDEHPEDPDAEDLEAWLDAAKVRLEAPGGRDTFGFAAVLYRRQR